VEESSEESYGSKRAVLPMMMMMMISQCGRSCIYKHVYCFRTTSVRQWKVISDVDVTDVTADLNTKIN
jgi:hypothetical protein